MASGHLLPKVLRYPRKRVNSSYLYRGVCAERDILLLLGTDPVEGDRRQPPVTAAMVKDTYIVDMDTRLDEVLNHMAEHHLGSAIVTRRGKLVGVFTVTDACRHFAEFLQEQVRRSGGDDAA